MIWSSSDLRFKWFWLSIDLRFKWFGCQLIWGWNDLVVNRFEIPMSWLSIDLRFKWFGCQMIWGSSDLVVNWCVIQMILSNEAFLRDFLQNWSFETQKRSFSARLPSKMKLWRSKTKLLRETSFKIQALNLKNEAFLRDFLQKWNDWTSKTKHFCETSFKNNAWKLKNEAFVRDFLQKCNFEDQKRSIFARLPSKMTSWPDTMTSEFQCVLTIFKWMLQKYCACHEKVEPRHTKSCNCHAKWSLQSNTSVTWNLQLFHGFCVGGFKHRHHKARNHCACHAKRIVSEPLQIPHACQRFCNPHELLRPPRILQRVEIPAPATRNTLEPPKTSRDRQFLTILTSKSFSRAGVVQILRSSTSKSAPSMPRFNDFDFPIALTRRRGANFVELNFQKCSEHASF